MNEPIIVDSGTAGPTVVILGGVHGNETCGVEALPVLSKVSLQKGKLILLYGNPLAIEQNVRFVEYNLNRLFCVDDDVPDGAKQSYEYQRSRQLLPYLDQADYCLDLHASFTPDSEPFIICESNAQDFIKYLPQNRVCYGFTRLEPGGSDGYMNNVGKIGVCVECGYLQDHASALAAVHSGRSFLQSLGMIAGDALRVNSAQQYLEAYELYYTKTDCFRLTRSYQDFEVLKVDEIIGFDGHEAVISSVEQMILFARDRSTVGAEAFLLVKRL